MDINFDPLGGTVNHLLSNGGIDVPTVYIQRRPSLGLKRPNRLSVDVFWGDNYPDRQGSSKGNGEVFSFHAAHDKRRMRCEVLEGVQQFELKLIWIARLEFLKSQISFYIKQADGFDFVCRNNDLKQRGIQMSQTRILAKLLIHAQI